jgi:molecular chaperone GrpE
MNATTDPQTSPETASELENDVANATDSTETATEPSLEAPADVVDPLTAALADAAQWKDLAYRNAAELDNFRKRTAREAQESRAYANADLLRALLPIMDNFEMGLEAARAESEKSMIFMGMSMVQRQISDFLREMGVVEVEAMGKAFDPNLHEAVSTEASETAAEGAILRVTRRGFKLKERLLRAASVIVASAPAPAEKADS